MPRVVSQSHWQGPKLLNSRAEGSSVAIRRHFVHIPLIVIHDANRLYVSSRDSLVLSELPGGGGPGVVMPCSSYSESEGANGDMPRVKSFRV